MNTPDRAQNPPEIENKIICLPESFNINISHQLFDYKITFANSQHKTLIRCNFVHKNWFETFVLEISGRQK